jgi:rubrerythrin
MDGRALETERLFWASQAGPVGSMPPPASLKGVIKTLIEAVEGHTATVFLDKLGERLAYERTGVRLYDALLAKLEAADVHPGGPTRLEIEHIRDDEHRHFLLLRDAIEHLGADPTAVTPCADVVGVAGLGWVQVLTDPRTTLTQCLDVMLVVELGDNDSWMMLADLAESLGFDDLTTKFRTAMTEEEDHLAKLRTWVTRAVMGQAKGTSPPRQPDSTVRR